MLRAKVGSGDGILNVLVLVLIVVLMSCLSSKLFWQPGVQIAQAELVRQPLALCRVLAAATLSAHPVQAH
jgi:hypothetical protein